MACRVLSRLGISLHPCLVCPYHPHPTPQSLNCLWAPQDSGHIPYPTVCAGNPCFGLPRPLRAREHSPQDPWPSATVEDVSVSAETPGFSQVTCFQCRFTGRQIFSHSQLWSPGTISGFWPGPSVPEGPGRLPESSELARCPPWSLAAQDHDKLPSP